MQKSVEALLRRPHGLAEQHLPTPQSKSFSGWVVEVSYGGSLVAAIAFPPVFACGSAG